MKAFSSVRIPALPEIKSVPIVAVIVDCLIIGAAIYYFTGPHTAPLAKTPEIVATKPTEPAAKPKVLGKSTPETPPPANTPTTTPAVSAIITQAGDTTPFTSNEPAPVAPPKSTEVAVVPPVTDPAPEVPAPATNPPVIPPATPADFTTAITQPGQVAAGTLIGLNNALSQKTYYGGDLVPSAPVTISRASLVPVTPITVTTPDGTTVALPQAYAIVDTPTFGPDITQILTSGSSFTMIAGLGTAPNGTYTVHITTTRTDVATGIWQYDGFITVTITD
jgi:Type IV secretory pathway, VirB10 components